MDLPPSAEKALRAGLEMLLKARLYAGDVEQDLWQFAVEFRHLRTIGLDISDIRWLKCKGFVEHARETTNGRQETRSFDAANGMVYGARSCLVLTEAGAEFADRVLEGGARPATIADEPVRTTEPITPCWDHERQELSLAGAVVKRFRVPAENQILVLAAFQEDGWPPRIDDPLPPQPNLEIKRRLHDTITALNRRQQKRLIRFHGDGTGEGVLWSIVAKPGSALGTGAASRPHRMNAR